MTLNFDLLQKNAKRTNAKDSHKFEQGYTLMVLLPSVGAACANGMPALDIPVFGNEIYKVIQRTVADADCHVVRSLIADGRVSPDYSNAPMIEYVKRVCDPDKVKLALPNPKSPMGLYAGAAMYHRRDRDDTYRLTYEAPQWFTGRRGKRDALKYLIEKEVFSRPALARKVFDLENTPTMVEIFREGEGFNTKWGLSEYTGELEVPSDVLDDLRASVAEGGSLFDLSQIVADVFCPDADELADKLGAGKMAEV